MGGYTMDTIQKALAAVYGMLGGNLDNIRDVDTVDGLLFAIASLGVGDVRVRSKP